jgi:hypothetical protein
MQSLYRGHSSHIVFLSAGAYCLPSACLQSLYRVHSSHFVFLSAQLVPTACLLLACSLCTAATAHTSCSCQPKWCLLLAFCLPAVAVPWPQLSHRVPGLPVRRQPHQPRRSRLPGAVASQCCRPLRLWMADASQALAAATHHTHMPGEVSVDNMRYSYRLCADVAAG